jgi:hypothetical protein
LSEEASESVLISHGKLPSNNLIAKYLVFKVPGFLSFDRLHLQPTVFFKLSAFATSSSIFLGEIAQELL